MLPNLAASPGLMLRFLTQLQQGQANGAPIEALYVGTHVLSDRGQVLEVTEAMIDEIVRNFAALDGPERIPISVNHNTGAGTMEEARAIGWIIKMFKQTEEGRVSLMMEPRWLDDARAAIEQEHFRFVSVGMMLRDKHPTSGEEIGAHVIELSVTNTPAISGLTPITLTALNAPSKVALSTQAVMALHPGNPLELRMGEGLPGSLMERVDCVIRCFYDQHPDSNEQMWLVRDVAMDQCIVSRRNGEGEQTWQVGYAMETGGAACTFAPMPQWIEVRQVYVPVTAPLARVKPPNSANPEQQQLSQAAGIVPAATTKKEPKMDEIQFRSLLGLAADADLATVLPALAAKAAKVEALEAKIAELEQVKASAAATQEKLAATEGQVLTLTQQKTAFEQETTTLAVRLKALEEERNTRSAQDRINLALKDRKVTPAELKDKDGFLVKLAKDQPETFDNIMAVRPAMAVNLTVELGSGDEPAAEEAPEDKLFRLTDEALAAADDKGLELSAQDARAQVLKANPDLRRAIKLANAG